MQEPGKIKKKKTNQFSNVVSLGLVCLPKEDEVDLNLCECHPHLLLSLCQTTPGWLCPATFGSVTLSSLACPNPRLGLGSPVQSVPGLGGKPVTIVLAAPGWEAATSLSPLQTQPVALCDRNQKQALLVTKVPSAQGAPWAGEGAAWGGCCPATRSCESVVLLTGCVTAER